MAELRRRATAGALINAVDAEGTLRIVLFDVTDQEEIQDTATLSKFPIEAVEGISEVADHISLNAIKFNLTGTVSDTPSDPEIEAEQDRSVRAWETLREIKDSRSLCDIITPVRVYINMVLLAIDVSRGSGEGRGCLTFKCTFEEIRMATFETTLIDPDQVAEEDRPRASGEADLGEQPGEVAGESAEAAIDQGTTRLGNIQEDEVGIPLLNNGGPGESVIN